MTRRRLALHACLAMLPVVLVGCGSSVKTNQNRVRTLNALIPAAGSADTLSVAVGSTSITGTLPVPFGQFANGGGYYFVFSGVFAPVGTSPALSSPLQFATPPTLPADNSAYTLAAAGQAGQTGALAPQFVLIPNYTSGMLTIPSGSAAVRVVNLSLNPNPIGLYATAAGVPSAALNAAFASVPYGYSSAANGYAAVPTSQLAHLALVDTTSTASALSLSTTNNLNGATFSAGQAYTLYVYGQPANGAEPLGATWVMDFPL